MNHLLRLVLVSAAPLVIVVATVLAATTPEPENQVNGTIYQYLSAGSASVPPGATIAQAVRAGRPWNFAPAMSHATFGSGVYFHVSQAFDAAYGNSSRALPYPPRDLWCVSLRDAGGASTSVVFVALHEDMYKADWILHESAATLGTPQLDGWLLNIGCGFGMGG